jgi:hypothetical protein
MPPRNDSFNWELVWLVVSGQYAVGKFAYPHLGRDPWWKWLHVPTIVAVAHGNFRLTRWGRWLLNRRIAYLNRKLGLD